MVCAILFGEELGHSQVLGCFRLRQGEEEQEIVEVGEEGSVWDGLVPGSRKLPRERGVVPSCLAASTLSFSLQGGAAFSPAILALILCTIIVRAPPGQAGGVRA